MGEGSATLVWFNAPGFRVLDIDDSEVDVVVSVETEPGRVGCPGCGVIAQSKDRRWVTVRDVPVAGRPVTVIAVGKATRCTESASCC